MALPDMRGRLGSRACLRALKRSARDCTSLPDSPERLCDLLSYITRHVCLRLPDGNRCTDPRNLKKVLADPRRNYVTEKEEQVYVCKVFHFEAVLDDVAVESSGGMVVCLGCYSRLALSPLPVPRNLRLQIEECLNLPVGSPGDGRDREH